MKTMELPQDVDTEKLAEVALAMMWLTLHDTDVAPRVWKGVDWAVLDLLHEKGWIGNPKSKNKSVLITEKGQRLGEEFLVKHFGKT